MAHPLDVIYVGTYPPRRCGIATFTRDLSQACHGATQGTTRIVALNAANETYDYPAEVQFEIRRDHIEDYHRAAEWINHSSADVVSIQHEFGIFGGPAGAHLFELLRNVRKPVVTTLHTVLKDPAPEYKQATQELIRCSDVLVVMSRVAQNILVDRYGVPEEKIALIYHGVPDVSPAESEADKRRLGFEGRFVVLTFGLLSENKGIETVIEALPPVVAKRPDLLYVILGATHPEVKKRAGERYREALQQRVKELALQDNVRFIDQFVELDTLLTYISASDLYITPYLHREQVVSGTLSYALAAGKAIISTPYWYAEELLADGRGVLVPFRDPQALSQAILSLIDDPVRMDAVRRAAYDFGRQMLWPEVGKAYAALFDRVIQAPRVPRNDDAGRFDATVNRNGTSSEPAFFHLPEVKLDHLKGLTDDNGLIQHAKFGVPDRRYGYSSDDAGRALAALLELEGQVPEDEVDPLITRYMSFLQYAQTADGHFHNFMNLDRTFRDERGSEDTLGRVIWGLGHVVRRKAQEGVGALAQEMLQRALKPARTLRAPRAWAYTICGLAAALRSQPDNAEYRELLHDLAAKLCDLYDAQSAPDWQWFEDRVTYGNAKMCEALLLAYEMTGEERFKRVGLAALDFLVDLCWNGEYFDLIGNQGWMERGKTPALFGQQPIDAGYLVEACDTAYRLTGEPRYLRFAKAAFAWFLGHNRLAASLYEESTGAVADGLDAHGVSQNQGAESVVCFLLALARIRRRVSPEMHESTVNEISRQTTHSNGAVSGGEVDAVLAKRTV